MIKNKRRVPRKLKKALDGLQIYMDTRKVVYRWKFRLRQYPRTKWVVKGERHMRRMVEELERKEREIKRLERISREMDKRILELVTMNREYANNMRGMKKSKKNAARIKKEMNSIKREEA